MDKVLSIEEIQQKCSKTLYELTWIHADSDGRFGLRAEFENHCDYFRIWATDATFIELVRPVPIWGGIALYDLHHLAQIVPKYRELPTIHFGRALVMWEDQLPLQDSSPESIYVIVAEAFTFEMGPDWHLRE